jgi:hypothetical protein
MSVQEAPFSRFGEAYVQKHVFLFVVGLGRLVLFLVVRFKVSLWASPFFVVVICTNIVVLSSYCAQVILFSN